MSRKSILVTGAAGRLGKAVIAAITYNYTHRLRDYDVTPVSRGWVEVSNIAAVINCVGAYNTGAWDNPMLWERMLDSNVSAQLETIMSALPHMMAGGVIVNVTAAVAESPALARPFEAAYTASKAAMSAATASLKAELQPLGIHVEEYQPTVMVLAQDYADVADRLVGIIAERIGR